MADLYLSGKVGWDITEDKVINFLNENDDKDINVYVNSPGGSVFDGLGVYNILRSSGRNITTINNGLAASMGSIIFLAGDKRIARTGSLYMVHKPSSLAWGNSDDLKKSAETLDKIQESLSEIYKERAGIEDIDSYINEETWWSVKDMLDKGIAHSEENLDDKKGETEDMAKIDDLRAELDELKAQKAKLEEEKAEAQLAKEVAEMKAELESMKEVETAEEEEKETEAETESETAEAEVEATAENKTEEVVAKATKVVKAVGSTNAIPAFMKTEGKY